MIPNDLLYAKSHEWVRIEDNEEATIGITHFAQEQLGDITFIDLPSVGDTFSAGDEMGSIESVKAASELYCPVSGEIIAINEALDDAPEKVNTSPFGDGWLVRIKLDEEPEDLLSPEEYAEIAQADH